MTIDPKQECRIVGPDAVAGSGVSSAAPRAGVEPDNPSQDYDDLMRGEAADSPGLPLSIRLLDMCSPQLLTDTPDPETGLFLAEAPEMFTPCPEDLTILRPSARHPSLWSKGRFHDLYTGGPKRILNCHQAKFDLFWADRYRGKLVVSKAGWCIYRHWELSGANGEVAPKLVQSRPAPDLVVMEFPAFHAKEGWKRIRAALYPETLAICTERAIADQRACLPAMLPQASVTTKARYEVDNLSYAERRKAERRKREGSK